MKRHELSDVVRTMKRRELSAVVRTIGDMIDEGYCAFDITSTKDTFDTLKRWGPKNIYPGPVNEQGTAVNFVVAKTEADFKAHEAVR